MDEAALPPSSTAGAPPEASEGGGGKVEVSSRERRFPDLARCARSSSVTTCFRLNLSSWHHQDLPRFLLKVLLDRYDTINVQHSFRFPLARLARATEGL